MGKLICFSLTNGLEVAGTLKDWSEDSQHRLIYSVEVAPSKVVLVSENEIYCIMPEVA